ncbi:MAG TPA: phospholipase D-like domain-containing protein [Vicinamibacterales bacterium]|nr:phospholipase D-like domain-containing protein [Vicinamibacterales bacterium]
MDRVVASIEDRRRAILDVIAGARKSIRLSLFRCNDPAIFEALAAASSRGVTVDVLLTSRAKGVASKLTKLWSKLEKGGATVHAYKDPVVKYHAKYLVADEGPAVVASFNFTRKCFEKTFDAAVVTDDPAVVAGLDALMAADCKGKPMPEDVSPRLIIGPERARKQFTALIDSAKKSIRLVDKKLSDPDLVTLLNAKRDAGLRVDVFASKQIGSLKSHGKILLIDDRVAVVGGLAIAAISLDFRREVAIVVNDPAAVAGVVEVFRTMDAVPTQGAIRAPDETGLSL